MRSRSFLFSLVLVAGCSVNSKDKPEEMSPVGAGLPAQSFVDFPGCEHPAVNPDCEKGWCRIPAGCFVMGSPEAEWGRGAYSEDQVSVTLTRAFAMQASEVTQAEWSSFNLANPSATLPVEPSKGDCKDLQCPVGSLTWFEAVSFANLMSERDGLPSCYELVGCTGELGRGLKCEGFTLSTAPAYECTGYRLPTEAEWEYAARAGTRTPFYSGDMKERGDIGACYEERALQDIAWYCANSGGETHPVRGKRPNGWGLFDMLGNASEFVHDTQTGTTEPGPLQDPGGAASTHPGRISRGGSYSAWPTLLRAASGSQEFNWDIVFPGSAMGLRLVRTLP